MDSLRRLQDTLIPHRHGVQGQQNLRGVHQKRSAQRGNSRHVVLTRPSAQLVLCDKWMCCTHFNVFFFLLLLSEQINLDYHTKNAISQSLHQPTPTCFLAAQMKVYSLMENNSYTRFINSDFYQKLCAAASGQVDHRKL